jgi:para-aminobenzoate synthetase component I
VSDLPLVDHLGRADPLEIAARFADLPYFFLLDSATGSAGETHQLGRYSFLTADPVQVVRSKGPATELGGPGQSWTPLDADPLAAVRELLRPWAAEPVPGVPPFQGGAAGFVGYD